MTTEEILLITNSWILDLMLCWLIFKQKAIEQKNWSYFSTAFWSFRLWTASEAEDISLVLFVGHLFSSTALIFKYLV